MLIKKLDKTVAANTTVVDYYVDHINGSDENIGDLEHPLNSIEQAVTVIKEQQVEGHVYNIRLVGDYIAASQIEFDGIAHKINIVSNDDSNKSSIIVGEEITDYTQSGGVVSFTTGNYPSSVIINDHVIEMNKSCDLHYPTEIYKPDGTPVEETYGGYKYVKIKKPSDFNINLTGNEIIVYYELWRTYAYPIFNYDEDYIWVYSPSWGNRTLSDITFRVLNNADLDGGFYFTESGGTFTVSVPFTDTVESVIVPTANENVRIKDCFGLSIDVVRFVGSANFKPIFTGTPKVFDGFDNKTFNPINTTQAGGNTYGAIMVEDSAGISISNCEFEGTYGYSIMIGNNCQGCHIEGNYFHDLLGGAAHISSYGVSEASQGRGYNYEISGNDDAIKPNVTYIKENLIKGYGRVDSNCCGVLVRFANDNYIEHNTICDGFYSGMELGYSWKYGNEATKHNHVAHNIIHHCLQFVTSDGGGIYTLGQMKDTIIEFNKIHDICGKPGKNNIMGIYFDQGTSDIIVRYNLVYGCRVNISIHYGRCIKLFNNFFAYCLGFNIGCNVNYYNTKYYNFLTLLNSLIIEDEDMGSIAVGNALVHVNSMTNSYSYYTKLAETHVPNLIDTPSFSDIGNGDFSWYNPQSEESKMPKFFSNTTEGVYKFYIGFLSEDYNLDNADPELRSKKTREYGVTGTYLRSLEPITERYEIDDVSENYDNYYRKLAMSLLHISNTYLLSVADDPV